MNVLITGANGFIGKNLVCHLNTKPGIAVSTFTREDSLKLLPGLLNQADIVIHLAGANRPVADAEFREINVNLTRKITELAKKIKTALPIIYASSTQAGNETEYGKTKKLAEEILIKYSKETGNKIKIYRLPGIMGKWCKPNYNSVVATFCHNIARNLPVDISDPKKTISLNYIDDLVEDISHYIVDPSLMENGELYQDIHPLYEITLGNLAKLIQSFKAGRENLLVEDVGNNFGRALYATYISYLEETDFSYELPVNGDERGIFVEFIKTSNSGQFSFFTCRPGISRGRHYHNTKTEKFLVVQGEAQFKFRQLLTDKYVELDVIDKTPTVVESIPGWVHDITNTGKTLLVVLLWSSEQFDKEKPDTFSHEI